MLENHTKKCPFSYNKDFELLFSIKNFPIYMGVEKKNYPFKFKNLNFHINKKTGTVQIHPRIKLKELYYKSHGSGTVGKLWNKHHFEFMKFAFKEIKGKVLEIGGGHNSIFQEIDTNFFLNKKINIISVEPNPKKTKIKRKLIKKFYDKKISSLIGNDVDLVLHSHLFEHIFDPKLFLKLVHKNLKLGGEHIFSVPNIKKMISLGYTNAMNFEHPFFLEEELIDILLKNSGFKILKKKYFYNHSIFYITKKVARIEKKIYSNFNKNKILIRNFYKKIINDVLNLNKKIQNYKNKNFFLFGAHIFSQYLLASGLVNNRIKYILDNDKNKQNKYLYGTKLKVVSPHIIKNINNPVIILRAANYNREIKSQLFKINNNVKFI